MKHETPELPSAITIMAAVLICIGILYIKAAVAAEPVESDDKITMSKELFQWIIAAAGVISLIFSIGYGFFKKQKYDNILKDRDEWEGIAKSREERIKELKYGQSEADARHKLALVECAKVETNLKVSNDALVSQSLQMKGILRELRLSGKWEGHEDRIYDDRKRRG